MRDPLLRRIAGLFAPLGLAVPLMLAPMSVEATLDRSTAEPATARSVAGVPAAGGAVPAPFRPAPRGAGPGHASTGGAAPVPRMALTLDAVATAAGPSVPAAWSVVALGHPARTVFSSPNQARPTLHLGPGRYEARVTYGAVQAVERFEVAADAPALQEVRRVVLNAGTLRPVAGLVAGSPPLEGLWTVIVESVPERRAGAVVVATTARQPVFHLAPGHYRLRFETGQVQAETVARVAPGALTQPRIALRAADITLVSLRGGRPLLGVHWQLFERPRQDRPVAGAPLAESAAPRARFVLPGGAYVVRVLADGRWYEQPFSVAPGTVREIPLILP
jgi:hypothetical protein